MKSEPLTIMKIISIFVYRLLFCLHNFNFIYRFAFKQVRFIYLYFKKVICISVLDISLLQCVLHADLLKCNSLVQLFNCSFQTFEA